MSGIFHTVSFKNVQRYLYRMLHVVGLAPQPKDHMLIHLCFDIPLKGSPALYGCWVDESINRILCDCAAGSHSLVHDRRVLAEFPKALALQEAERNIRQRQH